MEAYLKERVSVEKGVIENVASDTPEQRNISFIEIKCDMKPHDKQIPRRIVLSICEGRSSDLTR
jgi:hypothetical protein